MEIIRLFVPRQVWADRGVALVLLAIRHASGIKRHREGGRAGRGALCTRTRCCHMMLVPVASPRRENPHLVVQNGRRADISASRE